MAPITGFLADVFARIDQPVHLIAHSWGGLAALAATLRAAISPRSLITFEGNPMYVRPPEGDFPWLPDMLDMARSFEAAHAAGDPDAPAVIIDYWSKPGFFAAMPEPVQDYCRATVASNILDWRAAASFTPALADFATLDMPCTLVRGEHANPALAEVTDRLAQVIPGCRAKRVTGAGHFLITTHAADCAAIIDAHMAAHMVAP
jgi:pimeloyl-ACP methyl ester carboxylesterase